MDRAIQTLFQQHFPRYKEQHKLPIDHHRAANAFMQCRTAALGGHVQGCPHGHIERIHYNSCKHRSCPQCNNTQITRWLAKQEEKILACPHHHIIFTLPHEFNELWQYNRQRMNQLLFEVVHNTLKTLLNDPQFLGATPGIIAAFHSWGRNLSIHPHLHCLVTSGGLNTEGIWVTPKKSFLLPGRVVATLFRGKYLAGLKRLLNQGVMATSAQRTTQQWINVCNLLGRKKKWNVRIQERYDHAQGVVNYLARYARGGAVKNQQIIGVNTGLVTFRYKDHRSGETKPLKLKQDEFIQRVLEHVPPYRRQVIRSYGLYAGKSHARRSIAREHLGQPPETEVEPLDWQACCERMGAVIVTVCPDCQQRLVTLRLLPRVARAPPG